MMKRVLVIMNTLSMGGAETFVMKVFRTLDKERVVFDFLINNKKNNFYEDEVAALGGKVFFGISKSKNPIKSFSFIKNTVNNQHYTTVFVVAVHPLGFLDLLAAKLGGANNIVVRSTTSKRGGLLSVLLAHCCRVFIRLLSDTMIAPSIEAGRWLFGNSAIKKGKVLLLKNGIDTGAFVFDKDKRQVLRESLHLSSKNILVGHIGRFSKVKNHKKILDTFSKLKEKEPNARLALVGDGEDKEWAIQYTESLGLSQFVFFLGLRTDIPDLLCAFDVMLFPSFYEGMPNTIIEAQAVDLPCVLSDTITKDVQVTGNVSFLSLNESDEAWAQKCLGVIKKQRVDRTKMISDSGYSIRNTVDTLTSLFCEGRP